MSDKNGSGGGIFSNAIFIIGLIIAFNVFWPLGILMILAKLGVFKSSTNEKNIGARSKQSIRMDKYKIITDNRASMSIEYLASAVGVSYETALWDLQKMVSEGSFGPNAYINYVDRTLIVNPAARTSGAWTGWEQSQSQPRGQPNGQPNGRPNNRPSGGAEGSNMISRDQRSGTKKKSAASQGQTAQSRPASGAPKAETRSESRRDKKPAGELDAYGGTKKFLGILGVILTVLGGIGAIGTVSELSYLGFADIVFDFVPFLAMAAGGAGCLIYRAFLKKRENRFHIYAAACAGRDFVSIGDLASKGGVSVRKCKRDLDAMLERGLLPKSAYIDHGDGTLILKPGAEPQKAEPEPVEDNEDRYKAIIREIRKLNDDIPDEDVSRRIDEMEELTSAIFKAVQDKPEKEPQIKSFMSYYLPTTLKLLGSYAQFEQSGADGDNIRNAKAEIEHILDTLVDGFRKQLDKLYETDAIDISSDIDVLETMLRRDGLTGDGSAFNVQQQGK